MINHQNISNLFNFLKNNRNLRKISLNITKKGITKSTNIHQSDIIIKNKKIVFNTKINVILRQS